MNSYSHSSTDIELLLEVLTELDLDTQIYPCPKEGERYRPELVERGGTAQFPYLYGPNTDEGLFESGDILDHLRAQYA